MTAGVPGPEPDGAAHASGVPAIGALAEHGHATHDELVAAVAAILAVARRGSATGSRPSGERAWRATRLAALGLVARRR